MRLIGFIKKKAGMSRQGKKINYGCPGRIVDTWFKEVKNMLKIT